jgi:putative SOS response-associated peptidase YedK
MCNLYKMTKTVDEVARLFGAVADPPGNAGETVYPGYPGIVVAPDGGILRVRQMVWGFPLVLKGKNGQPLKPKPVNNCRTDKLRATVGLDGRATQASFMWKYSFQERRCLIPVTAFCEAEGAQGAKTRTWFSLPDQELFAVAGIWRDTAEWGAAYSMVMTEACEPASLVGSDGRALEKPVHDRMPAILPRDDWGDWLEGPPDAAGLLCRPWEFGMHVLRTEEPWVRR